MVDECTSSDAWRSTISGRDAKMRPCIHRRNKEHHNSQATPSGQEEYKDMLKTVANVDVNETSSIIWAPIHSIPEAKTMAYVGLKGSNREILPIQGDGTKPIHCTEAVMQT